MKLSCEIARDLMEMYEEGLCSPESRAAVEEHLRECAACRQRFETVRGIVQEETPVAVSPQDATVIRSFGKIRRRWIRSLIATLLVVPVLILSINQYRTQGVCFTNLDDILLAYGYVRALEKGDFEKAAGYMDYDRMYEDIQAALLWELEDYLPDDANYDGGKETEAQRQYDFNQKYYAGARDMSEDEFESFMKAHYADELQAIADQGVTFCCTGYKESYYNSEDDCWIVEYGMRATTDKEIYRFCINIGVRDGALSIGSMSHVADDQWMNELVETIFMSWPGEA